EAALLFESRGGPVRPELRLKGFGALAGGKVEPGAEHAGEGSAANHQPVGIARDQRHEGEQGGVAAEGAAASADGVEDVQELGAGTGDEEATIGGGPAQLQPPEEGAASAAGEQLTDRDSADREIALQRGLEVRDVLGGGGRGGLLREPAPEGEDDE